MGRYGLHIAKRKGAFPLHSHWNRRDLFQLSIFALACMNQCIDAAECGGVVRDLDLAASGHAMPSKASPDRGAENTRPQTYLQTWLCHVANHASIGKRIAA